MRKSFDYRFLDRVRYLSDIYCGDYSDVDPPLPIPNREVKRIIADGTDIPVGRVGSRHSLRELENLFLGSLFFVYHPSHRFNSLTPVLRLLSPAHSLHPFCGFENIILVTFNSSAVSGISLRMTSTSEGGYTLHPPMYSSQWHYPENDLFTSSRTE